MNPEQTVEAYRRGPTDTVRDSLTTIWVLLKGTGNSGMEGEGQGPLSDRFATSGAQGGDDVPATGVNVTYEFQSSSGDEQETKEGPWAETSKAICDELRSNMETFLRNLPRNRRHEASERKTFGLIREMLTRVEAKEDKKASKQKKKNNKRKRVRCDSKKLQTEKEEDDEDEPRDSTSSGRRKPVVIKNKGTSRQQQPTKGSGRKRRRRAETPEDGQSSRPAKNHVVLPEHTGESPGAPIEQAVNALPVSSSPCPAENHVLLPEHTGESSGTPIEQAVNALPVSSSLVLRKTTCCSLSTRGNPLAHP
jgi:hypothetical protein